MNWTCKTPLFYHFILGSIFRIWNEKKSKKVYKDELFCVWVLRWFLNPDLLPFVLRPSGDPPDAGQQEAAPCGGVPVTPGPLARRGGQSQERRASRPGARGRDSQHAAALGRRAGHAGNEEIHLGKREAHRHVASRWPHGPDSSWRVWLCGRFCLARYHFFHFVVWLRRQIMLNWRYIIWNSHKWMRIMLTDIIHCQMFLHVCSIEIKYESRKQSYLILKHFLFKRQKT